MPRSTPKKTRTTLFSGARLYFFSVLIAFVLMIVGLKVLRSLELVQGQVEQEKSLPATASTKQNSFSNNKLRYAVDGDTLVIQFGDVVSFWGETRQEDTSIQYYKKGASLSWVEHSPTFDLTDEVSSYVFSAKALPNNQGVAVVVLSRIRISQFPQQYVEVSTLYLLPPADGSRGKVARNIATFPSIVSESVRAYPQIAEVSPDGTMFALNLFGCWGCGGHEPEKVIINLSEVHKGERGVQNLGQVTNFAFLPDGSFQYKAFPMDCYTIPNWQANVEDVYQNCVKNNPNPLQTVKN